MAPQPSATAVVSIHEVALSGRAAMRSMRRAHRHRCRRRCCSITVLRAAQDRHWRRLRYFAKYSMCLASIYKWHDLTGVRCTLRLPETAGPLFAWCMDLVMGALYGVISHGE